MKPATITAIEIKTTPGNLGSQRVFVARQNFDPGRYRIILRINGKFYDQLKSYFMQDVILAPENPAKNNPFALFLPNLSEHIEIYAQLYDYKEDKIVHTKRQRFRFVKNLLSWQKEGILDKVGDAYFNLFWNNSRRVAKVEGPFDKDGKLQTEVKPGERYYFTALPNQKLHNVELLSVKWSYRYDDGEIIRFKNHNETTKNGSNIMDCTFHNEPKKIKVYAHFFGPSEKVMVEFANFEKTENAEQEENQIEEKPVENVEEKSKKGEKRNSTPSLIWSNKVTPEFCDKVVEISKRQNFDPNDLMAVMKVETSGTFSSSKIELKPTKEKRKDGRFKKDYRGLTRSEIMQLPENFTGAVGLIQFTPVAISSLNKNYNLSLTKRKLALMTQLEQLDYVEKYIELWRKIKSITNKISISDLYVLVFAPNYFGASDNTTLYTEDSDYYEANKSVDTDGKNGITKKEIAARAILARKEGLESKENFKNKQPNTNSSDTKVISDADIEFHIFSNGGEIQYKIKNEKRRIAEYFYHDEKGVMHNIGKQTLKKISNKYGTKYKDRIKGNSVYLVDIRHLKNYNNGITKFTLKMNPKTNRFFMNDVTLAALIGAMLDCGFDDFMFNGFSDSEGRSIGGSESHKNGMNGDLRYLRKDKSGQNIHLSFSSETGDPCGWKGLDEIRQNQFNDALYKFGWKSMLSWQFNGRLLRHCIQYDDHYHHLHVQSFRPKLKEIQQ